MGSAVLVNNRNARVLIETFSFLGNSTCEDMSKPARLQTPYEKWIDKTAVDLRAQTIRPQVITSVFRDALLVSVLSLFAVRPFLHTYRIRIDSRSVVEKLGIIAIVVVLAFSMLAIDARYLQRSLSNGYAQKLEDQKLYFEYSHTFAFPPESSIRDDAESIIVTFPFGVGQDNAVQAAQDLGWIPQSIVTSSEIYKRRQENWSSLIFETSGSGWIENSENIAEVQKLAQHIIFCKGG